MHPIEIVDELFGFDNNNVLHHLSAIVGMTQVIALVGAFVWRIELVRCGTVLALERIFLVENNEHRKCVEIMQQQYVVRSAPPLGRLGNPGGWRVYVRKTVFSEDFGWLEFTDLDGAYRIPLEMPFNCQMELPTLLAIVKIPGAHGIIQPITGA